MTKCLLVGGTKSFIESAIAPRLLKRGIEVTWHWSMDKLSGTKYARVPQGCELVVHLVDMTPNGHRYGPMLRDDCDERGIKMIGSQRKWAFLSADLDKAGYTYTSPSGIAETSPDEEAPTLDLELLGACSWEEKVAALKTVLVSLRADGLRTLTLDSGGALVLGREVVVVKVEETLETL